MPGSILESDWKTLRKLHPILLERFCQRILKEIESKVADVSLSPHQRYLAIYKLIQSRDEDIDDAFNIMSRSVADLRLRHMWRLGLMTDEELAQFSAEIQNEYQRYIDYINR